MRGSTLAKLALLVGALALSLGSAELLLRVVPLPSYAVRNVWPWLVFDPILGWRNQPGFDDFGVRIDARGFRASPFPPSTAPATGRTAARALRIACLGDSRTFGVWQDQRDVRLDADYPARLEARIRERRRGPLEVINAGVVGYASSHGLRQYVTRIVDLEVDVVIAAFGFNDHLLASAPARRTQESRSAPVRWLRDALSDSALYRLFETGRQSLDFLHPKPYSVPWVTPERYAENLRRFGEVSRDNGIRLLLLAFPLRPVARGDSIPVSPEAQQDPYARSGVKNLAELHALHDRYQAVLHRTADEEEIPLLDLDEVFRQHTAHEEFGAHDLVHFNTIGASLVAEAVHARLQDLGWLL